MHKMKILRKIGALTMNPKFNLRQSMHMWNKNILCLV